MFIGANYSKMESFANKVYNIQSGFHDRISFIMDFTLPPHSHNIPDRCHRIKLYIPVIPC